MSFVKIRSLLLAVVIGVGAIFISLNLLGMTSAALAQEPELTGQTNLEPMGEQALPQIIHMVVFTDPAAHVVLDLAGNVVGYGGHTGEVRCRGDNCNKKTRLEFTIPLTTPPLIDYQFKTLQALDLEARRSVVAGTGTINSDGQRARFLFTATFEDNGDGTVAVTYVSSRPEASFTIPASPGRFEIFSRQ